MSYHVIVFGVLYDTYVRSYTSSYLCVKEMRSANKFSRSTYFHKFEGSVMFGDGIQIHSNLLPATHVPTYC